MKNNNVNVLDIVDKLDEVIAAARVDLRVISRSADFIDEHDDTFKIGGFFDDDISNINISCMRLFDAFGWIKETVAPLLYFLVTDDIRRDSPLPSSEIYHVEPLANVNEDLGERVAQPIENEGAGSEV